MSEVNLIKNQNLIENPFVTFDSSGKGLSRVFDDQWDFHSKKQNAPSIGFAHIDDRYRNDIKIYLYILIKWQRLNSPDGTHLAVSTLIKRRYILNLIATKWGCSNFSLLSNEREWKQCSRRLVGCGSNVVCRGVASTINVLNKANVVHRYVSKREYVKWIKKDLAHGQSIAIPETIYVSILKKVVAFIETYYPYRHQISDVMSRLYIYQDKMLAAKLNELGFDNVEQLTSVQRRAFATKISRHVSNWADVKNIPNFQTHRQGNWLGMLLKMCFVCVTLFSAVRQRELLSMDKYSYSVTKSGISKLSGFTTKGERGNQVRTTWNSAPIAKLALELAFDATEATRSYSRERIKEGYESGLLTKDQYEYRAKELSSAFISVEIPYSHEKLRLKKSFRHDIDSDVSLNLKEFSIAATREDVEEFNLLNPDRKGSLKVGCSLPRLTPHDLRRSFVLFMVKNRLGNLLTVKYQLKHRNINMSHWYANYSELARTKNLLVDVQLMESFNEAIEASAVDALDDIYNQSVHLSGYEGQRIAKEKTERLAMGDSVIMSRAELAALVKSGDKSIILLPTGGYCTNSNCERLCSLIDLVEAPCKHQVFTDKSARRFSRERDALIASFRATNDMCDYANELILDARRKKIQSIEPTLEKHNIPYTKFNDEIKAIW